MTTALQRLVAEASVLAGGHHPCSTLGHKWKFFGGKNAGCDDDGCACSVPVHKCEGCGDYDYGDNTEADDIRQMCAQLGRD